MIRPVLDTLRMRYRLATLEPRVDNDYWAVYGEVQRAFARSRLSARAKATGLYLYGGKVTLRIVYNSSWPLDEFLRKARAIEASAARGSLGRSRRTRGELRLTQQRDVRAKVRAFIAAYAPAEQKAVLEALLNGLNVDHLIELQLRGRDSARNISMAESEFNQDIGRQLYQAMRELPRGAKIDKIVIVAPGRRAGKAIERPVGNSEILRRMLLAIVSGLPNLSPEDKNLRAQLRRQINTWVKR